MEPITPKQMVWTVLITTIAFLGFIGFMAGTTEPLSQTLEPTVVKIASPGQFGTGIVLEDGLVLTAGHVLDKYKVTMVRFSDGSTRLLTDIYIDSIVDVGIGRIKDVPEDTKTPWGTTKDLAPGTYVTLIGHPFGQKDWHSFGRIAQPGTERWVYLDIAANPGVSGGPILSDGKIIGIITNRVAPADGMARGVSVEMCRNIIARYRLLHGQKSSKTTD